MKELLGDGSHSTQLEQNQEVKKPAQFKLSGEGEGGRRRREEKVEGKEKKVRQEAEGGNQVEEWVRRRVGAPLSRIDMRWKSRRLNLLWAERSRQSRSDCGRGERKCGRQERNLKSHCSGGAEAESTRGAEESNRRQTPDDMDVSSAMAKVGRKQSPLSRICWVEVKGQRSLCCWLRSEETLLDWVFWVKWTSYQLHEVEVGKSFYLQASWNITFLLWFTRQTFYFPSLFSLCWCWFREMMFLKKLWELLSESSWCFMSYYLYMLIYGNFQACYCLETNFQFVLESDNVTEWMNESCLHELMRQKPAHFFGKYTKMQFKILIKRTIKLILLLQFLMNANVL